MPHPASLSLIFTSVPVFPKNALLCKVLLLAPKIISIITVLFLVIVYAILGSESSTVSLVP